MRNIAKKLLEDVFNQAASLRKTGFAVFVDGSMGWRNHHRMTIARVYGVAFLALLAFYCPAQADPYKVGDSFTRFQAPDQHGVLFKFKAGETKFVLFDDPGESGPPDAPKEPDWFTEHHALLIVNISDLSFIKRDIARSRLEAKPFRVLVMADKSGAAKFPVEGGKITVLALDKKGVITAIRYGAPGKEVQALLSDNK
jgi:hypothetical protein